MIQYAHVFDVGTVPSTKHVLSQSFCVGRCTRITVKLVFLIFLKKSIYKYLSFVCFVFCFFFILFWLSKLSVAVVHLAMPQKRMAILYFSLNSSNFFFFKLLQVNAACNSKWVFLYAEGVVTYPVRYSIMARDHRFSVFLHSPWRNGEAFSSVT